MGRILFTCKFFYIRSLNVAALACMAVFLVAFGTGCEVQRRKSDAELGLTSRQADGRHIYDQYCDRCHLPYSSKKRQGPSLKGLFKRDKLVNGKKVNEANVREMINNGGNGMPAYADMLSKDDKDNVVAYLKTL